MVQIPSDALVLLIAVGITVGILCGLRKLLRHLAAREQRSEHSVEIEVQDNGGSRIRR